MWGFDCGSGRRDTRDRYDSLPPDSWEVGDEVGGEDGGAGRGGAAAQ